MVDIIRSKEPVNNLKFVSTPQESLYEIEFLNLKKKEVLNTFHLNLKLNVTNYILEL